MFIRNLENSQLYEGTSMYVPDCLEKEPLNLKMLFKHSGKVECGNDFEFWMKGNKITWVGNQS